MIASRIPRGALAVAALLVPAVLGAQGAPRSAPISNVRYEVTFDQQMASEGRLHVRTTFDVGGAGPVLLSLPAWTPGAYEISNFARWVVAFGAKAGGGDRALHWDKLDFDTWRIDPAGARSVAVDFDYVADSLDNAMAWARRDFALFNGTNLFMYPEGQPLGFASQVTVRAGGDWKVTTGMTRGAQPNTYSATNYHDLVDMPFFVGRFDLDSAQIAGRWVRFASYPAGSVSGAARAQVWDQLRKVIPPEVAVFGEAPWANYTVMQIADSSYQGASGLEHQSSHVDVVTPMAIGSEFQPSLYAHEIFHSWNVKRLRPSEMWPYVYDRPMPTPWLWVSEGITDYYADLALVRGGVIDDAGFYAATSNKINEVANVPDVALEDASLNTWVHPVDGTAYIYYPKGSLAGLALDILIRDASDDRRSLDTVMRELYQRAYKQGRGFTSRDWWDAVSRAAGGRSFAAWSQRYIDGREPFPWDSILPMAGLRAERERVPRVGVSTSQDQEGIRVTDLTAGGAAAAAGVRVGDYLVAIGDIEVTDPNFGQRFRARYGNATEGAPLPITVRRGSQRLTVQSTLRFGPGDYRIEPLSSASEKALRVRNGILKGQVER